MSKSKEPLSRAEQAHKELVKLLNRQDKPAPRKREDDKPTSWPWKGGKWGPP
jgi:hypothetical protein